MVQVKKVVVTGAAGHIAYALLFRIAAGELLGKEQKIVLSLVDLPQTAQMLEAIRMELIDGAYPLLDGIEIGHSMDLAAEGAHIALFIGAKPRGPGMERKDLLEANAAIFVEQGKALRKAHATLLSFVIGNPCNTNAWILTQAGRLDPKRVYAMTQLDLNRAHALLAEKLGCPVRDVGGVLLWGNHSSTQVPDVSHAICCGKGAADRLDPAYRYGEFIKTIAQRGAAVIAQRGSSSAGSAAQAILDLVNRVCSHKEVEGLFSSGVHMKGNPYGIDEDLFFSVPIHIRSYGEWHWESSIKELPADLKEAILKSEQELIEERDKVKGMV